MVGKYEVKHIIVSNLNKTAYKVTPLPKRVLLGVSGFVATAVRTWEDVLHFRYQFLLEGFINSCLLKPNGNYMSHLPQQSVTLHFVLMGFV
jgi:hypothetical protein